MEKIKKLDSDLNKVKKTIINFICGFAIGGGAILPGVSGGVLCVIFGIYEYIMELFTHPFKTIKKNWRMFVVVAIGWVVGFWIFSNLIKWLFDASEVFAKWTFIGLVLGSVPSLLKEAGKKGRTFRSYISLAISFLIMFAGLMSIDFIPGMHVNVNIGWYFFAGILWGLSIVIPGMESASLLMRLGIFPSFNAGLSSFDLGVIIPWVIGIAIAAIAAAKLVGFLFEKHYSVCYHAVIGIVIASTVSIFPLFEEISADGIVMKCYSTKDIIISALCAGGGVALSFLTNYLQVITDDKTDKETDTSEQSESEELTD